MATAGFALALRPAHAPSDGDVVFAASTARAARAPDLRDLAEIGTLAAECLARAIARGVYEATPLPFPGAMPSWKRKWAVGSRQSAVGGDSLPAAHCLLPLKPIRPERLRVDERRLARHQLGEQPAADRDRASGRDAGGRNRTTGPCGAARGRSPASCRAGTAACPATARGRAARRAGSNSRPNGSSRSRWADEGGSSRRANSAPGRQPQAARHRRQQVAAFEIEHRPAEQRAVRRGVMHVIAALDAEREAVAEAPSARSEDHGPSATTAADACSGPSAVVHGPAVARLREAQRVAGDERAAARDEQLGVGLRQRLRDRASSADR